jgi:hypothetical protein
MAADAENRMDGAEQLEWLDHVTEWAHELAEETRGYAADCERNGGFLAQLKGDLDEVADLAEALRGRLRAELTVQRMAAGLDG